MKNAESNKRPVRIVGVLNTTPDSYVERGKYASLDAAVARAGEMLTEGADIIEIGGESTGPGSTDVSEEEELRRTVPVIRAIRSQFPAAIVSIDTWKSAVAKAALEAGALMVNDVTAGRVDQNMYSVLSSNGSAQVILMYSKDSTPRTTVASQEYDDVVATIRAFLRSRKDAAVAAGIAAERIILDPGLGQFISSEARYSFEILERLEEFLELGSPLLVSPSRKSFLAGPERLPVAERLPATLEATRMAILHKATYIRTHDVSPTKALIRTLS